jgi:stearoyl-CoA desaturase (delta-9 desaturase)
LLGIFLMLAIDVLLFGPIGITVWAVQMIWIPVTAAGIINGAGHYWGYRNFQPADASTNIVPWGILIGGEELHNNHHAHIGSAKLSSKWYEFDIGWLYIRSMAALGLAKVKRVAPKIRLDTAKTVCDLATLHAVMANRYEVMAKYAKSLKKTYREEIAQIKLRMPGMGKVDLKRVKHWLSADETVLSEQEKLKLGLVMKTSRKLDIAYSLRQDLIAIWQRSAATKEQMVRDLEEWCRRAEASGIETLQKFSRSLRYYA